MDKPVTLSTPQAEQRPYSYERHGASIDDPWALAAECELSELQRPDAVAYLDAENDKGASLNPA